MYLIPLIYNKQMNIITKEENMLGIFKPTWMVESIYNISPEQLKKIGVEVVLTDLDNTLIAWNMPEATEETLEWIQWMREAGIQVVIISNNSGNRVERVASILGVDFFPNAFKPTKRGFKKIFDQLEYNRENTVMVGDQILTDIIGANNIGIESVLVKPILDSDAWNTKINRFIELRIMKLLIKKDPEMKWRKSLNEPIE